MGADSEIDLRDRVRARTSTATSIRRAISTVVSRSASRTFSSTVRGTAVSPARGWRISESSGNSSEMIGRAASSFTRPPSSAPRSTAGCTTAFTSATSSSVEDGPRRPGTKCGGNGIDVAVEEHDQIPDARLDRQPHRLALASATPSCVDDLRARVALRSRRSLSIDPSSTTTISSTRSTPPASRHEVPDTDSTMAPIVASSFRAGMQTDTLRWRPAASVRGANSVWWKMGLASRSDHPMGFAVPAGCSTGAAQPA